MSTHILNRIDPLKKQQDNGLDGGQGLSPMDPPDAYRPPNLDPVPKSAMHPFLRALIDEHAPLIDELNAFEEAIVATQKTGYSKESNASLMRFFRFFDRDFSRQSRCEEAVLYPLLRQRLMAAGEHGTGDSPGTATDAIRDGHAEAAQLAAVVVNFLGLVFRLPDERSRLVVLDAALEQSKNLVELLRLLIFRKHNVLYSLAHRLITTDEFEQLQSMGERSSKAN